MLDSMRKSWRDLKKDEPGHRFQNRFKRSHKKGGASRVVKLAIGGVLIVAGIVLLVIPGPGSVLIVIGVALIAEESEKMARALDKIELRLRRWVRAFRGRKC